MIKEEALNGKPKDARLLGHFKIGFKVDDMDILLKRLSAIQVDSSRIFKDQKTGKGNLLIDDPDGNLIQFFE